MKNGAKINRFLYVLLLLPLVFIAYLIFIYNSQNISADEISVITIKNPDGDEFTYTDKADIQFYVDAILDSEAIGSPLRETSPASAMLISCDRGDKVLEFSIYPELSLTGCMLEKAQNKLFVLSQESAAAFLSRAECAYLYQSLLLPTLNISTGTLVSNVLPTEYEWYYQLQNGNYRRDYSTGFYDPQTLYNLYSNRDNALEFSVTPDDVTVRLYDKDGVILSDTDISKLLFANDTAINVQITAEWNKKSGSEHYGKAVYSFNCLYDIPSTVTLSSQNVKAGSYVFVNLRYLNELETVTLETPLEVSGLSFSENNGVKTAALAVSPSAVPGEYELNFHIGNNIVTTTLNVTARDTEFLRLSLSSESYVSLLGPLALDELDSLKSRLIDSVSPNAAQDILLPPSSPAGSAAVSSTFGTDLLINIDGTTDSKSFLTMGNVYDTVDNSRVYAAKSGKVVFNGTLATLGNVIVIDHGCGLQTWYYGLKTADRAEGSLINKGDIIGFAGETKYESGTKICFAISVCGQFTDLPE